jgi:predicted CopG family antitoxin
MQPTVRTTVTFPEDVYQQLKITAVMEKKTLSEVVTDLARQTHADLKEKNKRDKKDPMQILGGLHLGISNLYTNRDDLYEDHTKQKMGV